MISYISEIIRRLLPELVIGRLQGIERPYAELPAYDLAANVYM